MTGTPATHGFHDVASLSDVPEGELHGVALPDGERVCLFNHDGQIGAVRDECTHQAFPLSAGFLEPDGTIVCAWHGARFDALTGDVLKPPAADPVTTYEVRVVGDRVWVKPCS
jgi:nitrite reductase/ring-hydroxylating ferredoxin subunit